MDFESVLAKCGDYGRYQFLLLILFGYINILTSMHYYSQTIISFTPDFWCDHEHFGNKTIEEIRDVYGVFRGSSSSSSSQSSCFQLVHDQHGKPTISDRKCEKWIYDYESGYQSISTELNWVCDGSFQLAVGQSFFYIGSVVGTILFGTLADKIGRLPALIMSILSGGLGDFVTAFTDTLPAFAMGRFVSGLATDTSFYLMYIMVFEYLRPSKRTFGLNIITAFFYCFGLIMTPWLAIWLGDWRRYLFAVSIPTAFVIGYAFILCESAQWMITKNNTKGAIKCLKRVANINKRTVDESVFQEFEEFYTKKRAEENKLKGTKDSFFGMFRTRRLRTITIILFVKSMIITLAFDISGRNVEGLGTSPFLLFSLTSIVHVPAGLTIIWLQNILGRKGMASGSLLIGGIITTLTGFMIAFLDRDQNALLLAIMVALGRYGAVTAYDAEAQYAAELIPTCVRGRGIANVHLIGYGFSFFSAYIIYLGKFYKPLPSIFLSAIMLFGAFLCLFLPETLNKKLPESLAEGEEFGKDEKWYYFSCISRRENPEPVTEVYKERY